MGKRIKSEVKAEVKAEEIVQPTEAVKAEIIKDVYVTVISKEHCDWAGKLVLPKDMGKKYRKDFIDACLDEFPAFKHYVERGVIIIK